MQINNNRIADFYPPVPAENRNNPKLPVVYESASERQQLVIQEPAKATTVVVPPNQSQDAQQARFVRDFISSDRQFDGDTPQQPFLPKAVQQYLYIDALPAQNQNQQGRILDELV